MRELIILAGGLGSRLNGTEKMPKPLVAIHKKAVLTIIIQEYAKLIEFTRYNILITDNCDLYLKWKSDEMDGYNIHIVNEGKRTGRTGALKYFMDNLPAKEKRSCYAIANGDTILQDINRNDLLKCFELNKEHEKPVVLMVSKDKSREDTKNLIIDGQECANSGFMVINSSYLDQIKEKKIINDIDKIVFRKNQYYAVVGSLKMIDIGTPERLKNFRNTEK